MNIILPAAVFLGLALPVYNLLGGYAMNAGVNLPVVTGTYVSIFALVGLLAFLLMVLT